MKKFYLYFICCLLCRLTAGAQTSWDIGFPVDANVTATLSGGALIISGTITSVVIDEEVTSIGDFAFYDCSKLITVSIPESVKSIGNYVFGNCTAMTSILVDSNNTEYSYEDGVLFNKNKTTLIVIPPGKKGNYESNQKLVLIRVIRV